MKKIIITSLFSLLMAVPTLIIAQTDAANSEIAQSKDSDKSVSAVDMNQVNMQKHIKQYTKYPASAKKAGTQGKVFISFKVTTDGSIKDVKVLQGINKALDTEALRVIKTMPKWTPVKVNGKVSEVNYTVPISFEL